MNEQEKYEAMKNEQDEIWDSLRTKLHDLNDMKKVARYADLAVEIEILSNQ